MIAFLVHILHGLTGLPQILSHPSHCPGGMNSLSCSHQVLITLQGLAQEHGLLPTKVSLQLSLPLGPSPNMGTWHLEHNHITKRHYLPSVGMAKAILKGCPPICLDAEPRSRPRSMSHHPRPYTHRGVHLSSKSLLQAAPPAKHISFQHRLSCSNTSQGLR